MKKFFYMLVVACIALPTSAMSQPSLLINGSFEHGIDTGSSFITLYLGSTDITGWTVTQNNIDYVGGYWQAADGNRSLDMNGTAVGAIEQTFSTAVGAVYEVHFSLAGNPNTNPKLKRLKVRAGSDSTEVSFDATPYWTGNMGWMTIFWSFTATANQTTIEFISLNNELDNCCGGVALDNVFVMLSSATPTQPKSWGHIKTLYR